MNDEPYQPIACSEHERLEFAVLKRQSLRLRWRTAAGQVQEVRATPVDVFTRDGAEWLNYRTAEGDIGTLRLDRILAATPV